MSEGIKTQTFYGMIWSFIQRFGTMTISFVSNIVLARMLTPDDYGAVGMLMIFISIANTFVDGGFGSALIQKKNPNIADYSTIFWWNIFISIFLYAILYFSSPVIAKFYNLPILVTVLRIQGLVLFLNSLSIIQFNQLRKQLKFKRIAKISVISACLSSLIAIILAWLGCGIWSLVAQQLILSFLNACFLWVLNKWYPSLIFNKGAFKELFSFGSYILVSNLINTISNNFQGLLIGKYFSSSIMGYYTQALKLETVASHSISGVVEQVSYPVLSKFQNDNRSLSSAIYRLMSSLAYLTFPLMLILILTAEFIILFFYGTKWLPCVQYFQILCLSGIAASLQNITYYAVACKGKSKDLFKWTIIKRFASISCVILGFIYAEEIGLLYGIVFGSWICLIANSYLVNKHIGYTILNQFKDLLPIILLSVFTYVIVYYLKLYLNDNIYLEFMIIVIIYLVIYIGVSRMFRYKSYEFILELLKNHIIRH